MLGCMPKKEAKAKLTKDVKTIYLSTEVSRKLRNAAKAEAVSQSIYVEQTLRARFKKDGIK
jgi:predicted HicB family RNase H-like nuclease